LEDEIGVELLRRSPRGVRLTAEGRLFLEEVRQLLKRTDESVEKVRALVRGEYVELRIGYAPALAVEILPQGRSQRFANPSRTRSCYYMISQVMNSSLDYEMARWNSRT
jgi:hypothetical protein